MMIGTIGWIPSRTVTPLRGELLAEVRRVFAQARDEARVLFQQVERGERSHHHRRRQRVGEKVRPRFLAEVVDERFRSGGEAAVRAAERFAERRGVRVDLAEDAQLFAGAAAGRAEDAGAVRVVDDEEGAVLARDVDHLRQRRERAFHREDAVGDDDAVARLLRRFERAAQVGHVAILVALLLAFARRMPSMIEA